MKHLSFNYKEKQTLKNAQQEASKTKYKAQLIQIFTALTEKKKIQKILNKIAVKFPEAVVIGTTTAGEISHAKMYDNSTIISLSLFEKTKLISSYVPTITTQSGIKISDKICSKKTKAAVILSEGLHGEDYEGFIKGIKEQNSEIIIAGGLAGDNFNLEKTFVFLGTTIYDRGAVAVSFSGKKLFADNRYNLNWAPIGKQFTITKADGNIVEEIDNIPAVELFKKYLGESIFADGATTLLDFQLLFNEGSTTVARTPLTVDENKIILAGPMQKGQQVQFGFSNASTIVSGSNEITREMAKNPAESIYIYSCIARKTLLGKTLEKEFKTFEHIAPTAGFFTYGEFYSTTVNNALLNCTTTILVLSEDIQKVKEKAIKIDVSEKDLDNVTFSALTHFIEQTSSELQENLDFLNQYKNAVDMTSLISKTDTNGIITYVNDNFCEISQYSREELLGSKHNIIRDPNVSDFIFKKMWHNITHGRVWRGLLSNKAKDGNIYYVDTTIIPIMDEHGNIKEYMGIRQDITKQMQSKKRIQEKERLIKAIFDNQESIVIYASRTKGMLSVNKKLFEYLEFDSIEQFKEKHSCICDLFIEEEGYTYPKKHPNWINDIADGVQKETKAKIATKNGKICTFDIAIKKIDDEYIINLNDITSLEEALKQAYISEQAKSTFLANMSHEIRTPLNGILGFTDLLTKKDFDKDTKRYIDIIHKSGQTLLNVVNDILDFSKLESGELHISETDANLFDEMEATVTTFASVAKKKQVDYYTYIDTNIPTTLYCDMQRIKQVTNNLISNAIKFTPEQGTVSVSISLLDIQDDKANIKFSVKDTGIGIPEDKIATVFQAFSQADNSISRKFGGTGLGLSISSQYIKMMGSEIKVSSKEGEGSEFYFTLSLPIVNNEKRYANYFSTNALNVKIMTSSEDNVCGINTIITSYLNAWQCSYKEIHSLDKLNEEDDILIVCAKLFNQESCEEALDKYEKLQIIYIEDALTHFECSHKKFHLLEQPMTGSALFDKLISFANIDQDFLENTTDEIISEIYDGHLLIAEDNLTNQMLISAMLEEKGITFTIVDNGQEAVDKALNSDGFDLIFMDINMPVMDGIVATKLLREKGYNKPIVSLSANVIESDRESFRQAGVNDTLNKPIVPYELDAILKKYLTSKRDENQTEVIDFDIVHLQSIAKHLSIPNHEIIKKLLASFSATATELLEKLQEGSLTKDIAHNIKGVSGNMRFNNLYELAKTAELEVENYDDEKKEEVKKVIIQHLLHLREEIEKILT